MTFRNSHGGIAVVKPQRTSAKANKARATRMENDLAQRQTDAGMEAKRTPRSGAIKGVGLDGDVMAKRYIAECKNYTPGPAKTISLSLEVLDKIMEEGKLHGKPGILVVQPKGAHSAYVIVDRDQFITLMGWAERALTAQ